MSDLEPSRDVPGLDKQRTEQIRHALLSEVTREPKRRRRQIAAAGVATGVLLGLGVGSAAAWVSYARPDDPNVAYCSPTATLDGSPWTEHGISAVSGTDGAPTALDALAACAAAWRGGAMSHRGAPFDPTATNRVPTLTPCVVGGVLVVFPAERAVCTSLGVPNAER